jgi:aspartate dehydrogenase
MTRRIGLIGFGSIGKSIVDSWGDAEVPGNHLVVVLARHRQLEAARKAVHGDTVVTDTIEELLGLRPDIAVEAAGQSCVFELGPILLSKGIDLMLLSVGSLANRDVCARLRSAAQNRARILIPVGAIAGLDGLLALRRAGLERVTYISTKPPASWQGTPADGPFDLRALTERTVIFQGTAREAATQFPKNANLAAAVALAGLGFDDTRVELVADPHSVENVGRIEAEGATSKLSVVVAGRSASGNPKTSQITGMSVLSALANSSALLAFA